MADGISGEAMEIPQMGSVSFVYNNESYEKELLFSVSLYLANIGFYKEAAALDEHTNKILPEGSAARALMDLARYNQKPKNQTDKGGLAEN